MIEFALGAAVVFGVIRLVMDVFSLGYLPEPFFHDKADTFMDWYNPAYWAHNPGTYEDWFSIYPPLSFIFVLLFSRPSCYNLASDQGRACDPQGYLILSALMLVNLVITWLSYRKIDHRTAAPRAFAVTFGMSMLFGWERGNLIIPCFTCFVLGYGPLLRRGWVKAMCVALTINFKPYLILAAAGRLMKRDWRWLEMAGLWMLLIYAATYAVFRDGDPMQVLANTKGFAEGVNATGYGTFEFTTTYDDWLQILNSAFPIMDFVGSRVMETMQAIIPVAINLGLAGVALAFVGAAFQVGVLPRARLAALALLALHTVSHSLGGYGLVFALFLTFFEPWRGVGRIIALVSAYLWCFPLDLDVSGLTYSTSYSFLTNRSVRVDMPITLGQIVRPALVLVMEYGLTLACFSDLLRHAGVWGRPVPTVSDPSSPEHTAPA